MTSSTGLPSAWRIVALTVTCSLAFASSSCKRVVESIQESITPEAAEKPPDPIDDSDYRFKLTAPAPKWKLMAQDEAKKISPSAVAAAVDPDSRVFGVVIVEHLPGVDLNKFTALVTEQMGLEDKVVGELEDLQFQGEPAKRVNITGKFRDIPLRYGATLFLHQDYGYQLLAWGTTDAVGPADFKTFFDAFSLQEGEVKGRTVSTAVDDTQGVGWRVKNGVYESAVMSMRVAPPEGFRLLVGGELELINTEASVGWMSQRPDVYNIVLTERVKEGGFEGMSKLVSSRFKAGIGNPELKATFPATALGKERTFEHLESPAEFSYVYSVFSEEDSLIQVVSWYPKATGDEGVEAVKRGLSGLQSLEPNARNALEQELARLPDPQNTIGPTFSLRRGVYRDFQNRLRWEAPKSGIWEIAAGADARANDPSATLYLCETKSTTYGMLTIHPGVGSEQAFHETVLQTYANVEVRTKSESTSRTSVGEALRFTVSEGFADADGVRYEYHIATTVHDGVGYTFLFWGMDGLVDHEAARAAWTGLTKVPDMVPMETTRGEHVDRRVGFGVKLPSAWKMRDLTPAAAAPVGTVLSFENGQKAITIVGIAALSEGQDESWFNTFLADLMKEPLADISKKPKESQGRFLDLPAHQTTYESLLNRVDVVVFTRDRTSFGIVSSDRGEDTSKLARTAFRFVDD